MGNVQEKEGMEFPEYAFDVERGKIKEFVQAIGDPNPIYVDKGYAVKEGYKDVIAPPTFGVCIDMWGGPGFEKLCEVLEINPVRVLHGEQEFEYFKEINPGDRITARTKVASIFRKEGKSGPMNLISLHTTYRNQDGEIVLASRMLIVERA